MASDGLKYLRRVIEDNDRSALFQTNEDDFLSSEVANEVAVYNYLLTHSAQYDELPSVATVRSETGVRLPEARDALSYYLNKIINRKIYNAAREVNQDFRSDMASKDVSNLYAIGRRFMDISNDSRINNSSMYDGTGMAQTIAQAKSNMRVGMDSIPTGYPSIDEAMMGGLRYSDFVFLIARTNAGKSALMLRMAKSAYYAGKKILIISMELSMDDMSLLFMAHMANINTKFVNPYMLGTYDERLLNRVTEEVIEEDRVFIHKGGRDMTPNKVRWLIESLDPDLTLVDSLYLMRPDGTNVDRMDRFSKIATVVDQTLDLIVDTAKPLIATSQFNRQAGKGGGDGSLENIGFSDTISTHASLIISMKSVYIGDDDDNSKNELDRTKRELEVIKSRKGAVDPFLINYLFSPMNFDEIQREEEVDDDLEQEIIDALSAQE